MSKKVLITGATDGIGLEAAKKLAALGHTVLLHGRNRGKLDAAVSAVSSAAKTHNTSVDSFRADLSDLRAVDTLADEVLERHPRLDALINNAGVLKASTDVTGDGLDVRFAVNAIAPYRLTRRLLPALQEGSRIVNVSSAAQSPVNLAVMQRSGGVAATHGGEFELYSQSKLALTMWSRHLADEFGAKGPMVVAVNPGSMLGTKMVRDSFGVSGGSVAVGGNILCAFALDEGYADATGKYFNNDAGRFSTPHRDAIDPGKNRAVVEGMEEVLDRVCR